MIKDGIGGAKTRVGLDFGGRVNLLVVFAQTPGCESIDKSQFFCHILVSNPLGNHPTRRNILLTGAIFERTGSSELNRDAYIRAIAFFTIIEGFFVIFGAKLTYHSTLTGWRIILPFAAAIGFIFLFTGSDNP